MSNNTIIYPPYIKETIPAFIKSKIEIPFTNNPAISLHENKDSDKDDVTGFVLKVIEYISGNTVETLISDIWEYDTKRKSGIVYFEPKYTAYEEGQYYKFQLAYTNQNNINAYSNQQ